MASKDTHIVVIGAGMVGQMLIAELEKVAAKNHLRITVIEPKEYYENNIGSVRTVVDPKFLDFAVVPSYKDLFAPATKHIVGFATDLTDNYVTVNGENIPFDFAVVATGTSYEAFKATSQRLQDRRAFVQSTANTIKNARSILVVGGGPVGVEVAAEILTVDPNKKLTLVQSANALIAENPPKAQAKVMEYFSRFKNVEIVLGDRIEDQKEHRPEADAKFELRNQVYRTQKGRNIEADLLIYAVGPKPITGMLRPHLGDALSQKGYVKVNAHLQVQGHPKIFALGDVADLPQSKLAYNGKSHFPVVVKNLLAAAKGKSSLASYDGAKGAQRPFATSLGPDYAVAVLPMFGGVTLASKRWANMKTSFMAAPPVPKKK